MGGKDAVREERIHMEVIVDAYGSNEQSMGWYYYLDDKITFPFVAECSIANKRTPLTVGEKVTVTQMSGDDYCEYEMYVDILWNEKVLAVPLVQLKPKDADDNTVEAIEDWLYWKSRGYSF